MSWPAHFREKWNRIGPSKGLGDTTHKLLTVMGVAAVVEKVAGGPCVACGKRREAMNKAVPYKPPPP